MPKLWKQTIEAHRHGVREAILDTTWTLVTEHGLRAVTMAKIAEDTGIGRATLYKYFPDVETILIAWHQRHIAEHLAHLTALRDQPGDPNERLEVVLHAYARICYYRRHHHGTELTALLHREEHVAEPEQQIGDLIGGLLEEVAATGNLRDDIPPDELATYCLHALTAARSLPSETAIDRLVTVTLAGLCPTPADEPQRPAKKRQHKQRHDRPHTHAQPD